MITSFFIINKFHGENPNFGPHIIKIMNDIINQFEKQSVEWTNNRQNFKKSDSCEGKNMETLLKDFGFDNIMPDSSIIYDTFNNYISQNGYNPYDDLIKRFKTAIRDLDEKLKYHQLRNKYNATIYHRNCIQIVKLYFNETFDINLFKPS